MKPITSTRVTPLAEIVPIAPESDEVLMFLDGELVGIARTADEGRVTLATLVVDILTMTYGLNRATSHDLTEER